MKRILVALALVLLSAAAGWSMRQPEREYVTRVDTVAPAEMQKMIRELAIEADGLRARLEGRDRIQPAVVVRTDTVVAPPDTVLIALRATSAGTLDIASLTDPDSLGMWVPTIERGYDISRCDEGWSVSGGEVVCDRARFGHLYIYAALSGAYVPPGVTADAGAGVWWQPAYRSPWRVEAGVTTERTFQLTVRRGWRIF